MTARGTFFVSSLNFDTRRLANALVRSRGNVNPKADAMHLPNRPQREVPDAMFCNSVRRVDDDTASVYSVDDAIEGENDGNSETRGISISLFLTYLAVMGAKCALPSTLYVLTSSNSGLAHHNSALSRQDVISRLLALSTVSIAAGKLLLGPLIDTFGGVLSLQIALSTLFICLGSIGFGASTCPTLTAFALYWIVVDFAFSSCWAACIKTIRDYLLEKNWAKEVGRLAMAARTGNALGFAFFASLLQWTSNNDGVAAPSIAQAWLPVLSWMLGGSVIAMASMFQALRLEGESVDGNE
ncbi:hypothetical protein ACHAXA_007666 [Cyclostephanos tholiformis]|uniref:Uncharacterized protein n=1 Tax=Cyclostephanos tholiformis TaxID=382380 RepID=A0ABD3SDK9_9STRA